MKPKTDAFCLSERRGPLSRKTAWLAIRAHGTRAVLPVDAHPHRLRHACGCALADQGADARLEDVSNLLILCQIARPNSCRLMKSPITRSCICSVLEKQIVRRTNRLIRVRKLMCLLSIFCVFSFPTLWFSASR